MTRTLAIAVLLSASLVQAEVVKSVEGRYAIDVPVALTDDEIQKIPANDGTTLTMHMRYGNLGDGALLVIYTDYANGGGMTPDQRHDATMDAEIKGLNGKLIGKIKHCPGTCREATYRMVGDKNMPLEKTFRNILVGYRLYQIGINVVVLDPKSTTTIATAKDAAIVKQMFASFKAL